MKSLFVWMLAVCVALFVPARANAQDQPEVSASVQPGEVEVGEPFVVVLRVTVDASQSNPENPELVLPAGLRSSAPSISRQTQINMVNGHFSRRTGITATWEVVASREGVFMIPAPTVIAGGRKFASNALRVTVHPQGSGRRRPQQRPSPFDPFGSMFPPGFPGFFDTPPTQRLPEVSQDPELQLDEPLDTNVFLRAVVDQRNPIVGEQVTYTVYVYRRQLSIDLRDVHQPAFPDFLRRDLIAPDTEQEGKAVSINGVTWYVVPILKVGLFPLRAGELDIGTMQATIIGARGSSVTGTVRQSQPIQMRAVEPPLKGRPIGYKIGDVGEYTLAATVDPRTAEVGGALGVSVTVRGTGNVPSSIRVPQSSQFDWLEPQVKEDLEVVNGKVAGSRTFSYVVRPKTAGTFDLGEITLPYWAPNRRVYEIARAPLGKVTVAPSARPSASNELPAKADPWAALGKPRTALGPFAVRSEPFTEHSAFWWSLFAVPFAIVGASASVGWARRFRAAQTVSGRRPEKRIDEALEEARAAEQRGDTKGATSALDRALHLAVERATGLKSRGVLMSELPDALIERGLPRELANEAGERFADLERMRFAPDAASKASELVRASADLVHRLSKCAPKSGGAVS